MTRRTTRWLGATGMLVCMLAGRAAALDTTCTIQGMSQDSLAPADLAFPVTVHGEQLPLSIDEATGAIVADFEALPIFEFGNRFSSDSRIDTLDFQGEATGTIDAGGNVVLSHVRGINCTQGKCPNGGPPCPCIPGNLCSNDVRRVCLQGVATGDLACENGGVCQGVCSNDRTQTCASSADCDPPGFCGEGVGMRIDAIFSTGAVTFEGFTLVGSAHGAFTDGTVRLVSIHSTPPETYAIGDTGVSAITMTCDLDPAPAATGLPPAAFTVNKGTVKLGKGEPGDGDDKLALKTAFLPAGDDPDFATEALSITLANDDGPVVTLTVPTGSLVANSKGTKWKLVDKDGSVVQVTPAPPEGVVPSHKVNVKRGKSSYALTVSSKNLNLDGLDVSDVTTGLVFGEQTPSQRSAVKAKGSKRTF